MPSKNKFNKGDRVRYIHETYPNQGNAPDVWFGKTGTITNVPGDVLSPGANPTSYYCISDDARPGTGDLAAIREEYLELLNEGEQTWTFLGHWADDDTIVIDDVLDGQHEDTRIDDGTHERGLWADSGTGFDLATVQAEVIAEYEDAGVRP